MQVIFQDPYSSLNPRMTVGQIIAEPMRVHRSCRGGDSGTRGGAPADRRPLPLYGAALPARVVGRPAPARRHRQGAVGEPAHDRVRRGGLGARRVDPGPGHQPAGGSAAEAGLTYLFIAHDLAVVRHISTRVAVMYLGRIVEEAPAEELFAKPKHPYTQALLAAAPIPDPVHRARPPAPDHQGRAAEPAQPACGCVSTRAARWRRRSARRACRRRASWRRGARWRAYMREGAVRGVRPSGSDTSLRFDPLHLRIVERLAATPIAG